MKIFFWIQEAKIEEIKIKTTLRENETKVFITVTYNDSETGEPRKAEVYKKYKELEDAVRFIQCLNKEQLYDIEGDYYEAQYEEDGKSVLWYITFDKTRKAA